MYVVGSKSAFPESASWSFSWVDLRFLCFLSTGITQSPSGDYSGLVALHLFWNEVAHKHTNCKIRAFHLCKNEITKNHLYFWLYYFCIRSARMEEYVKKKKKKYILSEKEGWELVKKGPGNKINTVYNPCHWFWNNDKDLGKKFPFSPPLGTNMVLDKCHALKLL